MAKFEIGELVWYKGKKWEIADHLKGTYALWTPDHKQEVDGWVPEDQLAKDFLGRLPKKLTGLGDNPEYDEKFAKKIADFQHGRTTKGEQMSLNTEKQHIDNIINKKYLQKEPEPRGLRSPKPGNSCIGE